MFPLLSTGSFLAFCSPSWLAYPFYLMSRSRISLTSRNARNYLMTHNDMFLEALLCGRYRRHMQRTGCQRLAPYWQELRRLTKRPLVVRCTSRGHPCSFRVEPTLVVTADKEGCARSLFKSPLGTVMHCRECGVS